MTSFCRLLIFKDWEAVGRGIVFTIQEGWCYEVSIMESIGFVVYTLTSFCLGRK
jgi:hypothetical protein